ncbi:MAG: WecB/TagA/CpsF family glycosyltransferase [Micromonosporaceae bacterium]
MHSVLTGPRGRVVFGRRRVELGGVAFHPMREAEAVRYVIAALERGEGGTVVTPNVDILRQVRRDPAAGHLVRSASLVLADGMPVVWASHLARSPLPARVAGSDLIWSLCAAAAAAGRSIYLLGGAPGAPSVSQRAAESLVDRYPGLTVAGADSPPYGFDAQPEGVAPVVAAALAADPDIVFVGLGFPRQERLITHLAAALPGTWFVGCGASLAFAAGEVRRAPRWMRRTGLEWLHRLASEPRRLFRRYVVHDLPYAARLLTSALVRR